MMRTSWSMRVLLAFLLTAGAGHAGEFTVSTAADDGSGSLRQALASAAAAEGPDVIRFSAGLSGAAVPLSTFLNITDTDGVTVDATSIPQGITLRPAPGNDYGQRAILRVQKNARAVLRGLTVAEGGWTNASDPGLSGTMTNEGTMEVHHCRFINNQNHTGALANTGRMTVMDSEFTLGNSGSGSGITSGNGVPANESALIVRRCRFTNNFSYWHGAVSVGYSRAEITGCTFEQNMATDDGSAIMVKSSQGVVISECVLRGNNVGAVVCSQSTVRIERCSFEQNVGSFRNSGAVTAYWNSDVTIRGCWFQGNSGGAASNREGSRMVVEHSTFYGNHTGGDGGAVYQDGESLVMRHCTMVQNSASSGGGLAVAAGRTADVAWCISTGNNGGRGVDVFTAGSLHLTGLNFFTQLWSEGGDVTGVPHSTSDPLLAEPGDYGGATRSMALLPGSPARNAAAGSLAVADQRGAPVSGVPDAGAYETGADPMFNCNGWLWETLPASASAARHAPDFDFDGDGSSNAAECAAATAPDDPSSFLRIRSIAAVNNQLHITFPSRMGRSYHLQESTDLMAWTRSGPNPVNGNDADLVFVVTPPPTLRRIYFRVSLGP